MCIWKYTYLEWPAQKRTASGRFAFVPMSTCIFYLYNKLYCSYKLLIITYARKEYLVRTCISNTTRYSFVYEVCRYTIVAESILSIFNSIHDFLVVRNTMISFSWLRLMNNCLLIFIFIFFILYKIILVSRYMSK